MILRYLWWRVIFELLWFPFRTVLQNQLMLLLCHAVGHCNIIMTHSWIDSFDLCLHQAGGPISSMGHVTKHSWLNGLLIHTSGCAISVKSYCWSSRPCNIHAVIPINNIFILVKLMHLLMDRRRSIIWNDSRLWSWVTRGISLILELVVVDLLPRAGTIQLMLSGGETWVLHMRSFWWQLRWQMWHSILDPSELVHQSLGHLLWVIAVSTDKVLGGIHLTCLTRSSRLFPDLRPKISIDFSLLHSWGPRYACRINISCVVLGKTNLYVSITEVRSTFTEPPLVFKQLLLLSRTNLSYWISQPCISWIAWFYSRVRSLGCLRQISILDSSYSSREWCASLFVAQILASKIVWVLLVFHAKFLKYLVTFLRSRWVRIAYLLRAVHILFL